MNKSKLAAIALAGSFLAIGNGCLRMNTGVTPIDRIFNGEVFTESATKNKNNLRPGNPEALFERQRIQQLETEVSYLKSKLNEQNTFSIEPKVVVGTAWNDLNRDGKIDVDEISGNPNEIYTTNHIYVRSDIRGIDREGLVYALIYGDARDYVEIWKSERTRNFSGGRYYPGQLKTGKYCAEWSSFNEPNIKTLNFEVKNPFSDTNKLISPIARAHE